MVVVAVVHEIAIATSSKPCRKPPRRDPEPQLFASVIVFPERVAMACVRDVRVSPDMCVYCSCWTVADCLLNVLDCSSCRKVAISSSFSTHAVISASSPRSRLLVQLARLHVHESHRLEMFGLGCAVNCSRHNVALQPCLQSTSSVFEHGVACLCIVGSQTLSHSNRLTRCPQGRLIPESRM